MKKCYIVGAGDFFGEGFAPAEEDLIIAADGGYKHLLRLGISPDILLGDFDSLENIPESTEIIRHSPIKDDTDTALCVEEGLAQGCDAFYIFGGTGGRLDHTIANIQLLSHISLCGADGFLFDREFIITAITNTSLRFCEGYRGIISVFCAGERAEGVYLRGLKYPLTDAVLENDIPLGVSNEFTGRAAEVRVEMGTCTVMWQKNSGQPFPVKSNEKSV